MKKQHLALILAALLLFTTACSGGGSTSTAASTTNAVVVDSRNTLYNPETDCLYPMAANMYSQRVAETENGYYIRTGCFLMFSDKETGAIVAVCAKPNCLHNEEPDEKKRKQCNAYFEYSFSGSVFYIGGNLYVFHKVDPTSSLIPEDAGWGVNNYSALTRVAEDGSERKTIILTESKRVDYAIIHRGRFYCIRENIYEDGYADIELLSWSLSKPEKEPVCHYISEKQETSSNIATQFFAYGNYLYLKERDMQTRRNHICILNLETQEWSVIEPTAEEESVQWAFIADDALMLVIDEPTIPEDGSVPRVDGLDAKVYKYALDGWDEEYIGTYSINLITADDRYIYIAECATYVDTKDRAKLNMFIYDHDFNLIDQFSYSQFAEEGKNMASTFAQPTMGDWLIVKTVVGSDDIYLYFDRSEIGSGNIQVKELFRYNMLEYTGKYYKAS